jgi:hypothetical protein
MTAMRANESAHGLSFSGRVTLLPGGQNVFCLYRPGKFNQALKGKRS